MQAEGVDEISVSGLRAGKSLLAEAMGGAIVKPTPAFTAPDGSEVVNPIDEAIATPEFKEGDVVQLECGCWGWIECDGGPSFDWQIRIVHVQDECPRRHRPRGAVCTGSKWLTYYLKPGDKVELLDDKGTWSGPWTKGLIGSRVTVRRWADGLVVHVSLSPPPIPIILFERDGVLESWPLACVRPVKT